MGDGVGGFNGRDNAFRLCQIFKSAYGFIISNGDIFGPSCIIKMRMLRSHARIIQSCGNGMGKLHISILIL